MGFVTKGSPPSILSVSLLQKKSSSADRRQCSPSPVIGNSVQCSFLSNKSIGCQIMPPPAQNWENRTTRNYQTYWKPLETTRNHWKALEATAPLLTIVEWYFILRPCLTKSCNCIPYVIGVRARELSPPKYSQVPKYGSNSSLSSKCGFKKLLRFNSSLSSMSLFTF